MQKPTAFLTGDGCLESVPDTISCVVHSPIAIASGPHVNLRSRLEVSGTLGAAPQDSGCARESSALETALAPVASRPSAWSAAPSLNLSSLSAIFAVPPNGSVVLRSLLITGALLPASPYPLPAASFLALSAFKLPASRGAGSAPPLQLSDVLLATPSCVALSLHQDFACRASPSPNFTVTPSSLIVHRYTTPTASITNVTLVCTGAPAPFPCLATSASSVEGILAPARYLQNLVATGAWPVAEVATPVYVYLCSDVSLQSIAALDADNRPVVSQLVLVIAGNASGNTALDLADVAGLITIMSANSQVQLHNLTIRNPPLGPLRQRPWSLLRAILWAFAFERPVLGSKSPWLVARGVRIELPPAELAYWFATALGRKAVPPELRGSFCAEGVGSYYRLQGARVVEWASGACLSFDYLGTSSRTQQMENVTFCIDGDAGYCNSDSVNASGANCGIDSVARQLLPTASPPSHPPNAYDPQEAPPLVPLMPVQGTGADDWAVNVTVAPGMAVPAGPPLPPVCALAPSPWCILCRANPEGVPGVMALDFVRLIGARMLPVTLRTPPEITLSHTVSMPAAYDASIYGHPERNYMVVDRVPAALTAPAVLLGDYLQPLALDVGRVPAAIALHTVHASFTARAITLVNLPPAGLYPTMDLVPDAPGLLPGEQWFAQPPKPPRPPPALQTSSPLLRRRRLGGRVSSPPWPRSPSTARSLVAAAKQIRRRGSQGTAARGAASRRLLQVGEAFPAETQGLPLGLANFTSCVWTLDFGVFSRRAAAGTLGPPALPAAAPQLDPPRVFLDSVTLLVPQSELVLLAWCAAHNSTAVVTDPWVAQELVALLRDSELMRPDVVRRLTAAVVATPEDEAASPQLANITFSRFCWCGLQGRNVTLASQLPYVAPDNFGSYDLPVRWEVLQPPSPAAVPEGQSTAGGRGPGPPAGLGQTGKEGGEGGMPSLAAPPSPVALAGARPPVGSSGSNQGLSPQQQHSNAQDPAAPVPGPDAPGLQFGSANQTLGGRPYAAVVAGACSAAAGLLLLLGLGVVVYRTCAKARRLGLVATAQDGDNSQDKLAADAGRMDGADDEPLPEVAPDAQPPACSDEVSLVLESSVARTDSAPLQDAGLAANGCKETHQHHMRSGPASPAEALARMHGRVQQLQGALLAAEGQQCEPAGGLRLPSPRSGSSLLPICASNLFCGSRGGSYYTIAPSSGATPPSAMQSGPAAQSPLAPTLVLSAELGRGAQGVVYAGTWRGLDVAVKSVLLRGQPGDQRTDLEAAVRKAGAASGSELGSDQITHHPSHAQHAVVEAAIAASVSHPNVVACYTFELSPLREDGFARYQPAPLSSASMGTTEPARGSSMRLSRPGADPRANLSVQLEPEVWRLLLVMERCNAGSLRDLLASCAAESVAGATATAPDAAPVPAAASSASGSALPAPASPPASCLSATLVVRLALHVARGMAYLHSRCVVHGDLSSSNVLLHMRQPADRKSSSVQAREDLRPLPVSTALRPAIEEPPTRMYLSPWWAATMSRSRSLGLSSNFSLPLDLNSTFSLTSAPRPGVMRLMHEKRSLLTPHDQEPTTAEESISPDRLCSSDGSSHIQEAVASGPNDTWTVRQGLVPQLQMPRLTAKLCDFGLSANLRSGEAGGNLTHVTGPQRRSSLYSAPELVRDGHSGYKQDVYAFGVLLWELACGAPLPDLMARPAGRLVREWLRGQAAPEALVGALPPELLTWPEGTPRDLRLLAERCVQEEPPARPNFRDICAALERATDNACKPIWAL